MTKYNQFNTQQYETSEDNDLIDCNCYHCGKIFKRQKWIIKSHIASKTKTKVFCSTFCNGQSQITSVDCNCANCDMPISRIQSVIKKSKTGRFFCDRSCSATYNNTHKTHGTRRSKMESHLEYFIKSEFPSIKLLCNDKSAIGSELDFYFPDLMFAIELNGIFHYEPIYGQDKLDKIQNNDNRKVAACRVLGIELAIIDSSSVNHLTEKAKVKYSTIVNDLIKTVLSNR